MSNDEIIKIVEAILFVAGEPVEISVIAETILIEEEKVREVIEEYSRELAFSNRGIKIIRLENRLQMTTNEKYYKYIEKIYKKKALPKLSESLLETLAIVSFKQPITKNEISKIRGVNSDYNINKLIEYNIIREVGRSNMIGRPLLFGTTDDFLKFYGITSIEEFKQDNQIRLEEESSEKIDEIKE